MGLFKALLWFWPFGDPSADWLIVRRLIVLVSVAVGLIGGGWVLRSEIQKQRFDRNLLAATLSSSADGMGMNIAVMDYASTAFLADAYVKYSHVRALQITDRYGFLIYGPETIDMADYPPSSVLQERPLFDTKRDNREGAEPVGMLRQVVVIPTIGSILPGALWKGMAVGLLAGMIIAATMRFYMRAFVIQPLEQLTEVVAKASETGKFTRIEYLSETQFGIFARNFNKMQDRLEHQAVTQQGLIELNSKINDDLRRAYERNNEAQRQKLAQFDALGRVLFESQIVLTYFDQTGQQVFSNSDQHPVPAIAEVLQKSDFDSGEIISQLTASGLVCHLVSHPDMEQTSRDGSFEIEVLAQDGRTWVLFAGPHDVDGQVILCTNISNLRKMEQQLRQKQKMEALGRLVGGVAHEFNNMLGIILGNLDLLELVGSQDEADRQNYVVSAQRAAERAAATVTQLLTFARQRAVARQRIEIDSHFAGLGNMLRGTLGPGIKLSAEIEHGIVIDCDPGQLDGAIINLAMNAKDAMSGAGTLCLRVFRQEDARLAKCGKPASEFCVIEMEDEGPGVPLAIRQTIFEPFFSTKVEAGKGVGLGLATVAGFVEAFGGSIEVRSGASGGALFVLRLPAGSAQTVSQPVAAPLPFSAVGMRCMIVEDEADLRKVATSYLGKMGFICDAAGSLAEARVVLGRRQRGSYQLLFCDVQLPDGNGAEMLGEFRDSNPSGAIIWTSGHSIPPLTVGASDSAFLAKPYGFVALHQTIVRLLNGASRH